MQSKVTSLKGLKRELKINVPSKAVEEVWNKFYQELQNKVSIKGFRKGKYPKSLLEKKFQEDMQLETKKKIIPEYLSKAVKEHKLKIVTQPKIEDDEIIKNKPFEFKASFEIFPEFKIPNFKEKFSLKKTKVKIIPEEIENYANLISLQNCDYKEKKEAVKDKDQVNIEIHFQKIDGKEENKRITIFYYVGSNEISKELDSALIGMKEKEKKQLTLKVSPHTLSRDIAGKKISIAISIIGIAKPLSITKDKNFYQKINPEIKTEEDLKTFSKKSLQAMREKDIEMQEQAYLRTKILQTIDFAVPEESLQNKIQDIKLQQSPEKSDSDTKSTLDKETEERIKKEALDSLRYQFFLARLIEEEKIQVTETELEENLRQLAKSYGVQPSHLIQSEYGKNLVDMVRSQIKENKVLNLIREKAARV